MTAEEWRPIAGFPGYRISSNGRVLSELRPVSKMLIASPMSSGYLSVKLYRDAEPHGRLVHVLVAEAFIGQRPTGYDVCHGDGNRSNNTLANLRYDTRSANLRERRDHGTDPNVNKTQCPAGHPYDQRNTYTPPGTRHRICRACGVAAGRRYRARKSVAA